MWTGCSFAYPLPTEQSLTKAIQRALLSAHLSHHPSCTALLLPDLPKSFFTTSCKTPWYESPCVTGQTKTSFPSLIICTTDLHPPSPAISSNLPPCCLPSYATILVGQTLVPYLPPLPIRQPHTPTTTVHTPIFPASHFLHSPLVTLLSSIVSPSRPSPYDGMTSPTITIPMARALPPPDIPPPSQTASVPPSSISVSPIS